MSGDEEQASGSDQAVAEAQRLRLTNLARDLRRYRGIYQGIGWDIELGTIVYLSLSWVSIKNNFGTSWLAGLPFLGIAVYAIAWPFWRSYRLRLRKSVSMRIKQAGLVQAMAEGWDKFRVIHDYAPWYWRFMLGRRPKSDADWLYVIVANLDWYLQPEQPLENLSSFKAGQRLVLYTGIFGLLILMAVYAHQGPLKSIQYKVLLKAIEERHKADAIIPPPASSAPPAAPPCPPG